MISTDDYFVEDRSKVASENIFLTVQKQMHLSKVGNFEHWYFRLLHTPP